MNKQRNYDLVTKLRYLDVEILERAGKLKRRISEYISGEDKRYPTEFLREIFMKNGIETDPNSEDFLKTEKVLCNFLAEAYEKKSCLKDARKYYTKSKNLLGILRITKQYIHLKFEEKKNGK